jgi:hypothetical protein
MPGLVDRRGRGCRRRATPLPPIRRSVSGRVRRGRSSLPGRRSGTGTARCAGTRPAAPARPCRPAPTYAWAGPRRRARDPARCARPSRRRHADPPPGTRGSPPPRTVVSRPPRRRLDRRRSRWGCPRRPTSAPRPGNGRASRPGVRSSPAACDATAAEPVLAAWGTGSLHAAAGVAGHRSSGHRAGVWDCVMVFGLLFSCHCWEWRWVPGWARLPGSLADVGIGEFFWEVREQVTPRNVGAVSHDLQPRRSESATTRRDT